MAKDPGFIFYPGDYLRDTQCLSEKTQVAYDRIMCEHMRNICISQEQLNFFTKRLTEDEKKELAFLLVKVEGGFQIEWVASSISKRRSYSESRAQNRSGKNKEKPKTYVTHMDNEIDSLLDSNTSIGQSKNKPTPLVQQMIGVYLEAFPKYFREDEKDFSACFSITQKVETLKGWSRGACMNGKMDEFMVFWKEVVEYVKGDDWLSSRSITDLSTREWQRLGQHMSKEPKERKKTKKEEDMTDYQKELLAKREAMKNRKEEA